MATATIPSRMVNSTDRIFYSGMALLAATIVFIGFSPTFYLNTFYTHRVLTPLVIVRGTAFTAWIALLVTQTLLVMRGRTDIHRRLGVDGGVLAPTMVVLGLATAFAAAKRSLGSVHEIRELAFLPIPFGAMAVFAILVGWAFYWRYRPDIHKRLVHLLGSRRSQIP
jgi:hypothetical protein